VRWSRRVRALVAVAVLAAAAGLVADATGLLARTERTTIDARFALRGTRPAPRGIVIVAIDQDSLARLPRLPFPRSLYARVIDRLHAAGARAIAFDLEFQRPTTAAQDDALIGAAARARPVVFATSVIDRSGGTEVLGGPALRRQIGAVAGATAAAPDSSGVVRRVPYAVNGLRSFSVVIAALVTGHPADRRPFAGGGAPIDYRGPAGTFATLPFVDVLRGRVAPAALRGRIAIVGATAPSGQDIHPSPLGILSGAEVQANALATVLAGVPLRDAPGGVSAAMIVALALVVPLAAAARRALVTVAATLAALVALAVGAQLAFDAGRIVDVSDAVLALGLAAVATVAIDYGWQDRERRRLREQFAAFSPDVVAQVLERAAPALPATRVIGGYRMEEVVGRGAMGVVYKATQLALNRPVAVKVISPRHAGDRRFRERFERESRIAASVEHPNVIPVYEAGEDDGLLFIAMRYVDGVDLGELVARLGPLAPRRAAAVVAEVAGALDAAHARGLVHRDVKPANILLTADAPEHAYLTDFGIAKVTTSDETAMTVPGQWLGTVDYVAPEQLRGEPPDGRGDVYALGGVLFYALTGSVPYPLESDTAKLLAHVSAPPPAPGAHDPLLAAFDPVLARAMAKAPAERFGGAGELAAAAASAARAAV
jgi:CHASE2 domain-containing sensor protein/predicted Ser/Thr protein kinase